ncbi:NCS2 family permease [Jeotgalibacillus salarius]|uniref:NCS2 family permease n=1 Tax=Jeotgalibacillus salarius TaxID=546023 RepID=A0A4Y8LIY8_9BACL|nr:NCS2 family permease [Jeotgalibacillus salarius]TFE02990.1 NCS2 family permease [Jeotgalibacillus salarius]
MKSGGFFELEQHGTSVRKEVTAGVIGFFTIVYIVAVNALILSESGMPFEGAVIATIAVSALGCILMAVIGKAPIILVPGMGINAMFTYTLVQSMGFTWQEALTIVTFSGILFIAVAFTKLSGVLSEAIPQSLKDAITVGLGFFLLLIGLEKGALVIQGENSILAIGHFNEPQALATIITLLFALVLFIKNVPGHFLWTILFGTGLAFIMNITPDSAGSSSITADSVVWFQLSFESWLQIPFWIAVFSMTMVLVFENIGLVHGHTAFIKRPEKYSGALKANALSAFSSGLLGSSPTVSTVESTAAMAAGGRTGLTSLTVGVLFIASAAFIPYMGYIPDHAIAPILMIIGILMIQQMRHMNMEDFTESIPSIMLIVMIPFTYSIADGIAIGFILYPLLKFVTGRWKEITTPLLIISILFLVYFILHFLPGI